MNASNWSNGGGDYNPQSIATETYAGPGEWENYNVTSKMQEYINNPELNYGFILVPSDNTLTGRIYRSSEYWDTGERPKLTITYEQTAVRPEKSIVRGNKGIGLEIISNMLMLRLSHGQDFHVRLCRLNGEIFLSKDFSAQNVSINIGNCAQGVYLVTVNGPALSWKGKIVIKR